MEKEGYVPLVRLKTVKEKEIRYPGGRLEKAEKAADLAAALLQDSDRECVLVCCVNSRMEPISLELVAIGTINNCVVCPREVFKHAILCNAAYLFLFHNHPSGEPSPSADDRKITERIREAGDLLGIQLLDHIIIGDGKDYFSFKEQGLLTA